MAPLSFLTADQHADFIAVVFKNLITRLQSEPIEEVIDLTQQEGEEI